MEKLDILKGIIAPVDVELIKKELTGSKLIRWTNKGNNQIYIVTAKDSPNTMQEIGRLREMTFRLAGGGTGKEADIDEFDETDFKQIIVWDPVAQQIIGGYRFAFMEELIVDGKIHSPAAEIFNFSNQFVEEFAPAAIELGRSFVQPEYQPKRDSMKGIFSLDNLWDGLGYLMVSYPEIKFFFGKMTMYKTYNRQARNLILYFLEKYFPDPDKLVFPKPEVELSSVEREIHFLTDAFDGNDYEKDKKNLQKVLREVNESIPPLFNAYMNLSPDMKCFGTADNPFFGGVEETGILITIQSVYPEKKERHMKS
ncbi:MAG: GNAT family N-acyltransferase [Candidatus Absconditicoccaceae bacterium]